MSTIADPIGIRSLHLENRIVMSPMTRSFSPDGIPGDDVAAYYRRRAVGGTGLIITEGIAIDHASAVDDDAVPRLHGPATDAWRRVVDGVHAEGGRIIPQLWHVGPLWGAMGGALDGSVTPMRPSGLWGTPGATGYRDDLVAASTVPTQAMTDADIAEVIDAYRRAAHDAVAAGFDGVALHGGHGYLLDSFLWNSTNQRDDRWGGDFARRAAFPAAVVAAVRAEIGDDLPIIFRFSQHKQQDYRARIAQNPEELGTLLRALVDAGVDVLDASARRFHTPAFEGSDLTLAGWAKHLTGARSIAVGSVGIGTTLRESRQVDVGAELDNRTELFTRLAAGEFDLVAIGRLHLAAPDIARIFREGEPLPTFSRTVHESILT